MKTKLFTQTSFFLLMGLVLAFGVQGTTDAADLPLSITSGDLQTKSEDETFEISFTVGIRSNTTAIRNSDRELIDDGAVTTPTDATSTPPGIRIDNSGYVIKEINGTDYRLTTPINADTSGLGPIPPSPTGYTRAYAAHQKRPSPFNDYVAYSGVIYANSSGNAFSSDGYPLYYHIPAQDLSSPADGDTSDTGEPARTTSQIKIQTDDFYPRRLEANRYHYNQEAISILVSKNGGAFAAPPTDLTTATNTMTFQLKASGFQREIAGIAEVPGSAPNALPRSVTLIGTPRSTATPPDTTGTYKIRIVDATPVADTPWTTAPAVRAYIEFTLYVVEETPATNYGVLVDGTTRYLRVDTGKKIERVSSRFNVVDTANSNAIQTDTNLEIRYRVAKGSGTLYAAVGEEDTPYVGPNQDLTVHQNSKVFLNTNSTDNEVSASIAGQDRRTFSATIVYEYSGSDRRTTTTPSTQQPTQQPTQQQPQVTTLTVASNISGAPGATQTLRITSPVRPTVGTLTDTFRTAGGSATSVAGAGPLYTTTLTLPSTAGAYSLTVAAGLTTRTVTVTVTGATDTAPQAGDLFITSDFSGAPGSQSRVTIRATNADNSPAAEVSVALGVTNGGGTFSPATVTTRSDGTAISTLTRGSTPGTNYFITARANNYDTVQSRISITGTAPSTTPTTTTTTTPRETAAPTAGDPGLISIEGEATRSGTINQELDAPLVVEVLDSKGARVSNARVTFRVKSGQGRLSQRGNGRAAVEFTDTNGFARADYTPMSARSTVTAEVRGVARTVTFTITTDGSTPQTDATSDTTSPQKYEVRDEIPISLEGTLRFTGSRTLNGITYTCVGPGECVVSFGTVVKGEIQAAPEKTTASQTYKVRDEIPISLEDTLSFTGKHTVNGTIYTCVGPGECVVSFGTVVKGEIRVSAASATPTRSATEINPEVKVGTARRPMMVWVDGGGIYALAGADVQEFTPSVENAVDIAIHGNTVYWIEKTGERSGTVNSAALNGSNAKVLKTLTSAPKGLAVDTANRKLYLTNGWGKIQRMNLDGSQYETNVITGLTDPMGIAVSSGNVYWTEAGGSVRAASLTGAKLLRNIVTGAGTLSGIVADGKNVYWTEQTGPRSSRIRAANLDGTAIRNVYTVTALVNGLGIDPANNRLYWTNGWGKVQRSVNASRYQDVVTGLMNPMAIAIGGPNSETPAEETPKASTPTTAANKYDVNGDGSVDSKDVTALIDAISLGVTASKYDVNGDGTVDILDASAVNANLDAGAAGAPMLVGMKLSAVQIERLQEQIDLLIATGDRSPSTMKVLIYLQQLIVMARPEQTQLLANYPNPFNPETWIPYELATDTDVRITIYNAQGVVIRTLQLGQQSAGYYTDRERAAYWDGRNALGEQVASGIYFYQLETDDMSSLRKMVILK